MTARHTRRRKASAATCASSPACPRGALARARPTEARWRVTTPAPVHGIQLRRDCLSIPSGSTGSLLGMRAFLFEALFDVFTQLVFKDFAGCGHRQRIEGDDPLGCLLDGHALAEQELPESVHRRRFVSRLRDHIAAHFPTWPS